MSHRNRREGRMRAYIRVFGYTFLIVAIILCIIVIYYFRNLSLTKYNKRPLYLCEKYLEETYDIKFALLDNRFYSYDGYYIWEMKYEDKDGLEFKEYYTHPIEGSEGFYYIFFQKDDVGDGIRDYYWQEKLEKQFGEQFDLKSLRYEFDGYAYPKYIFDVQNENDIGEVANIITSTLKYVLKNTSNLSEKVIDNMK